MKLLQAKKEKFNAFPNAIIYKLPINWRNLETMAQAQTDKQTLECSGFHLVKTQRVGLEAEILYYADKPHYRELLT
jgi:hypothetical protein